MPDLGGWVEKTFGRPAKDLPSFQRALTHGSQAAGNYQRLEFLGDRVLGLVIAEWLFERFPEEPEGALSRRLNSLVTGPVCADVARELGVVPHLRLGKQARDDGADVLVIGRPITGADDPAAAAARIADELGLGQ